jgi:hypothetical protein
MKSIDETCEGQDMSLGSSVFRPGVASGMIRGHSPYNLGQRIRRLTPYSALSPTSHSASPATSDCRFTSDYDRAAAAAADAVNEFQITLWPNAARVAARGVDPGTSFSSPMPRPIKFRRQPSHLSRMYAIETRGRVSSGPWFSHRRLLASDR